MEIDPTEIIIFGMALIGVISAYGIKIHYKSKSHQEDIQTTEKRVKKSAVAGQVDAVETMKEVTTDSIVFLKQEIEERNKMIKKLRNALTYYKSRYEGMTGMDDDESEQDSSGQIVTKKQGSGIDDATFNLRMNLVKQQLAKNNVNPLFLEIPELSEALENIVRSPNFERIAATFVQASGNANLAAPTQANPQDL